jgi:DNA helicase II / ATP-dependent DNA helicase PcrA
MGQEVADAVDGLIKGGIVSDPSDIAILLRSTQETPYRALPITQALRARGISIYNPRSKAFTEAEEISSMLGGLIRLVDQDLVFGSQQAPRLREAISGWCSSWDALAATNSAAATYVLKFHQELKKQKPPGKYLTVTLLDLFYRILSRPPFTKWMEDKERTARLGLLSDILESYNAVEGGMPLKMSSEEPGRLARGWLRMSFYPRLIGYLQRTGIDDPGDPDYEIVKGKVQMMTVHQAKGLEFPVVFVGSIATTIDGDDAAYQLENILVPRSSNPRKLVPGEQRALQDAVRFYYVAYSRARDLLCVFGITAHFKKATAAIGRSFG